MIGEFRAYCEYFDPDSDRIIPVYAIEKEIPWSLRDGVQKGTISAMTLGDGEIVGSGRNQAAPSFWRGKAVNTMTKENEIIFTSGQVINIDAISGALITLSSSILILNSKCKEGASAVNLHRMIPVNCF